MSGAMRERSIHPRLLGLYGYPGSGKDAAAKVLVREGWRRVAFADPMKEMLIAIDPWIDVYREDMVYAYRLSTLIEKHGSLESVKRGYREVRRLLRKLGTEAGRDILGQNIWVDAADDRIKEAWSEGVDVVVTDVRFPNEAKLIKTLGGYLAEVARPGHQDNGHVSESHYASFPRDVLFYNGGTKREFCEQILTWCQKT